MLLSVWKATLPASERKLIDFGLSLVSSGKLGKIAPQFDLNTTLKQLKGETESTGPMISIGNLLRSISANPERMILLTDLLFDHLEKQGIDKQTVSSLLSKVMPLVGVEFDKSADLSTSIHSAVYQVGTNMKDPLPQGLGAPCLCPSCNFLFMI